MRSCAQLAGGRRVDEFALSQINPRVTLESTRASLKSVALTQAVLNMRLALGRLWTGDQPVERSVSAVGFDHTAEDLCPKHVIALGSGSNNACVAEVVAHVLGCPVFVPETTMHAACSSAAIGAAQYAIWSQRRHAGDRRPFDSFLLDAGQRIRTIAELDHDATRLYDGLLPEFARLSRAVQTGTV